MLKNLDSLSPEITLYYRGYNRHPSSISGILSIITYLGIVILSAVFAMDFLLKKNPTAYFYNKFMYDVGIFSFNNTGIFHFIVTGEQTDVLYDDRVFNVIGLNEEYDVIKDNSNTILYDHWIYESCSNIHIGKLIHYLDEYNSSYYKGLCISKFYNKTTKTIINYNDSNFKFPTLEHGNSNTNGNTYGVFLLRCQNHTELGKTNCYDIKTSDEKGVDTYSFSIYFIDQYIDVSNYHYPLTRFYNKVRNQIVLSSFTINHLNFNPLKLTTHSGIIINSNSEINSFKFDVNEKFPIEESDSGIYGSFYFWMANQMAIYDRTYQKIQDISASISGISKLLMIIGYFINYLFAKITLINDLSYDISKKIDKFGKKTNTRGFKSLKILNYSNIINKDFPFMVNKEKNIININNFNASINSNSKLNNNMKNIKVASPLYNNLMEDNISKLNLKGNFGVQNSIMIKKPSIIQILSGYLCCSKNHYIINLENIRIKVLSEEKLFTSYFILGALSDIFLKKYLNNNNNNNNTNNNNNNINNNNNNTINLKKNITSKKNNIRSPQQNIFISPANI